MRNYKMRLAPFITFVIMALVFRVGYADSKIVANTEIDVFINGQAGVFSTPPLIVDGHTLLPLRELLLNLGVPNDEAHIRWDGSTRSVVISHDSRIIKVEVGSSTAYLNGQEYQIGVAPIIYHGNVFLPARFVAQSLGKQVIWDETHNRILIGSISDTVSQQVIVNSAQELIAELGSNKKIILMPGTYDLSSVEHVSQNDKGVIWNSIEDGDELQLNNITNMTIEGSEQGFTQIITTPRYANVFSFHGCDNITLKNIYAGHTPAIYKCDAGVLNFENCSDVSIEDCDLYGCGSIGIQTLFTKRLVCTNTKIYYCSFKAILIEKSESIHFSNCTITDNQAYTDIIYVTGSKDISFQQCEISKNKWFCISLITAVNDSDLDVINCKITYNSPPVNAASEWGPACFIKVIDEYVTSSGRILFKNTSFESNECDYFTDTNQNSITFENCTFLDNAWGK